MKYFLITVSFDSKFSVNHTMFIQDAVFPTRTEILRKLNENYDWHISKYSIRFLTELTEEEYLRYQM